MANTYHDIGSRIKHRRTGIESIDDQTQASDHDHNSDNTHTLARPSQFLEGLTPRLTKSLVNFEMQSFVLLKFEIRAFGVPETK